MAFDRPRALKPLSHRQSFLEDLGEERGTFLSNEHNRHHATKVPSKLRISAHLHAAQRVLAPGRNFSIMPLSQFAVQAFHHLTSPKKVRSGSTGSSLQKRGRRRRVTPRPDWRKKRSLFRFTPSVIRVLRPATRCMLNGEYAAIVDRVSGAASAAAPIQACHLYPRKRALQCRQTPSEKTENYRSLQVSLDLTAPWYSRARHGDQFSRVIETTRACFPG